MFKPAKKKIMTEDETIQNILKLARREGVEDKVKAIIMRFRQAVQGARNEVERKQIAALGLAEIHKTIGCVGSLVVDGCEVLPENTSYQDEINAHKNLVKIE